MAVRNYAKPSERNDSGHEQRAFAVPGISWQSRCTSFDLAPRRRASLRLVKIEFTRNLLPVSRDFYYVLRAWGPSRALQSPTKDRERERERGEVYADRKLFYFSFSLDERTNERTPFLSDFDSCPSCFAFPPAGTRSTGQLVIPLHAGETSPKRDHSQSISVILLIVPAMSPSGRNEFNGLDRANRRRRRLSLTLPLPLSWGLWLWAMTRSSGLNAIAFWFSRIHPFPLHKSRR